jgi:menaquinone-dependent protoporphyrinogen oxidase
MIPIFVASRDGQAERIALHIATGLRERSAPASVHVLTAAGPLPPIDASAPIVVLVAAVRYGKHLPEAETFLTRYASSSAPPPLALASVNLVARKPNRQSVETNQYLRNLIARHRLKPVLATAFAGRLCYPRYNWFDRQAIRLIMAMSGGNADGRSTIEYTDWAQVDEFVMDVTKIVAQK